MATLQPRLRTLPTQETHDNAPNESGTQSPDADSGGEPSFVLFPPPSGNLKQSVVPSTGAEELPSNLPFQEQKEPGNSLGSLREWEEVAYDDSALWEDSQNVGLSPTIDAALPSHDGQGFFDSSRDDISRGQRSSSVTATPASSSPAVSGTDEPLEHYRAAWHRTLSMSTTGLSGISSLNSNVSAVSSPHSLQVEGALEDVTSDDNEPSMETFDPVISVGRKRRNHSDRKQEQSSKRSNTSSGSQALSPLVQRRSHHDRHKQSHRRRSSVSSHNSPAKLNNLATVTAAKVDQNKSSTPLQKSLIFNSVIRNMLNLDAQFMELMSELETSEDVERQEYQQNSPSKRMAFTERLGEELDPLSMPVVWRIKESDYEEEDDEDSELNAEEDLDKSGCKTPKPASSNASRSTMDLPRSQSLFSFPRRFLYSIYSSFANHRSGPDDLDTNLPSNITHLRRVSSLPTLGGNPSIVNAPRFRRFRTASDQFTSADYAALVAAP